jgi:hypothetical protein
MIFYRDGSNVYALEDRDGAMMLDIAKGNWD